MQVRIRWKRSLRAICLTLFFALSSFPALAFELVAADPVVDSTITTAPSAISLTFSGEVTDMGSSLSVRAPSGMAVDDGSLLIDGANALIGLKKLSEGGRYTVTYQFMSAEGEILSGTYSFTYDAPAEISTPSASVSPSVNPSANPEESQASPGAATGKSSRATDIFMVALLVTSFIILVVIGRSLRNGSRSRKPKSKKRKQR